jgi:hypothetical protein
MRPRLREQCARSRCTCAREPNRRGLSHGALDSNGGGYPLYWPAAADTAMESLTRPKSGGTGGTMRATNPSSTDGSG